MPAHHAAGDCSAYPGCGKRVSCGWLLVARSSPVWASLRGERRLLHAVDASNIGRRLAQEAGAYALGADVEAYHRFLAAGCGDECEEDKCAHF